MYEPARFDLRGAALLWPAMAAASVSDMAALVARQFANLAVGADQPTAAEPQWATAHAIALQLRTGRLRDFSDDTACQPTLLCAPLALHSAAIADFEPNHTLVAALRHAGLRRLFAADWRSASSDMRYLGIDDYLADLCSASAILPTRRRQPHQQPQQHRLAGGASGSRWRKARARARAREEATREVNRVPSLTWIKKESSGTVYMRGELHVGGSRSKRVVQSPLRALFAVAH